MNFLITASACGINSRAGFLILCFSLVSFLLLVVANRHRLLRFFRKQHLVTMGSYLPEEEIYNLYDNGQTEE